MASDSTSGKPSAEEKGAGLRLLLELGPLVLFFVVNARADFYTATKVFMVAIVVSLVASRTIEKRLPVMPLVTAVFVLVFGGLTVYLEDELFMKLKPTVVNLLFATILAVGLARGRMFLELIMGSAVELSEDGWRALTVRWTLFFVLLAGLNELVWRNASTDAWVSFKVFGIMPLTIVFAVLQIPLMKRHALAADDESPGSPDQ